MNSMEIAKVGARGDLDGDSHRPMLSALAQIRCVYELEAFIWFYFLGDDCIVFCFLS